MLAERVKEWTEEWKQEGCQEGRQKGLQEGLKKGLQQGLQKGLKGATEEARAILRRNVERRFGALNGEAQRRLEAISSLEDLMELSSRLGSASSLAALGLTEEQE